MSDAAAEPPALDGLELASRARYRESQVRSFFHPIYNIPIPQTRTHYRVHWLAHDANDRTRINALAAHLYHRITDYCTPQSVIREAQEQDRLDGGTAAYGRLQEESRRLFMDADPSGEGGELLLYFLLEAELQLPQILCKMPLKTNSRMPIHGVDGVHAGVTAGGNLAVYWGESKLYTSFANAASDCLSSIEPFLKDDGTGPTHRDLVLVRHGLDVGDRELSLRLVKYFTDGQPERLDLEVRGACLIAFTYDDFGYPFMPESQEMLDEVQSAISDWQQKIQIRLSNRELSSFEIEFYCLPLPAITELRDEFRRLLGHNERQ
jgi:hypothetical protein